MPCVKTAISVEESLFKEANELARKMKVSRSRLVSLALAEYVGRRRAQQLIQRINEANRDFPDEQDEAFFKLANASSAKLTENDEW